MKIITQSIDFTANESLLNYVEEKLNKLDVFYDQIVGAQVYLKLDNNNSKENKVIDIRLEVPGDDIVVSKAGQEFPEIIDLAYDTLKRLVIKKKEKSKTF